MPLGPHAGMVIFLIALGLLSIVTGVLQVRRGWRDGTFYGKFEQYHESRTAGPIGFWSALAFRALLIPAGVGMLYLALALGQISK
jgi:hypothetical protein